MRRAAGTAAPSSAMMTALGRLHRATGASVVVAMQETDGLRHVFGITNKGVKPKDLLRWALKQPGTP